MSKESKQPKPSKPNVAKQKVTETVKTTGRIVKNTELLVQATALLIVSVFTYTQADTITNQVWYYTVIGSLIVVGLRAAYEFITFLGKERKDV